MIKVALGQIPRWYAPTLPVYCAGLGTCRFAFAALAGVKLSCLPFEGCAPVQDGSGQRKSLPLKL
jgi:hypothetical protein